jgi:phosphate transport system protein
MAIHLLRDLEHLRRSLFDLGGLVEQAIDDAITALVDRRADLALQVLGADDAIDRKEVEVEEECLKLLALHQPVAADLRFLVAVLKMNNDLERMGDLAGSVAERAAFLAERDPLAVELDFRAMGDRVRTMVRESLDALLRLDPVLAHRVRAEDDAVDAAHRRSYQVLEATMQQDPAAVERAVQMLSASRHLERIADYATNIAEDVIFLVEGSVIRHKPKRPLRVSGR